MDQRGIFRWLTIDMAVFAALNAFLLFRFQTEIARLQSLGFFEFAIMGLAAYRASNILSNEVVTKPLRSPFVDEVEKDGKVVEEPKKTGFLGATGLLVYCPSCTGVWLSAGLAYAYVFWPGPAFFVAFFLALSAVERILAISLGWFKRNS
ncbi:MAG: DUF1360 domain-containing protein [Fibrobacteria bacterium]